MAASFEISPALLAHFELGGWRRGNFKATLKGLGLYNTFQFVLCLSPDVHRKIETLPTGVV